MSCSEGTGCECGAECGDGETNCEAYFTVDFFEPTVSCHGFGIDPMTLGCSRCGLLRFGNRGAVSCGHIDCPQPVSESPICEARYTVHLDKREVPFRVSITKNGNQIYCGTDQRRVMGILYG